VIDGCAHDCRYCYAKAQAIRFERKTAENWKDEQPRASMAGKKFGKRKGTIMFPTTHDITMENVQQCTAAVRAMLKAGNNLLIVSKPDHHAMLRLTMNLHDLPNGGRDQILFRFTIGSLDRRTLAFWEPGAPSPAERLYALMQLYFNGWKTSVSVEPMLDKQLDRIVMLWHTLEPYVTDAVWFGRMNQSVARLRMNGHGDPETMLRADELKVAHADGAIQLLAKTLGHPRPKLKWKESLKPVLGIPLETEAGTDR
jgi:DNA repair photolyase